MFVGTEPNSKTVLGKTPTVASRHYHVNKPSEPGLLVSVPAGQFDRFAGVRNRLLVFGWIGFDLRAKRDPFAQPNETVERGLFVEPEKKRAVVVNALVELLQYAVDGIEFGQSVEDDPHPVGALDARREDDDPVAVVARVLDAIEVELLG